MRARPSASVLFAIALALSSPAGGAAGVAPLASWNDGEIRERLVAFVERVTDREGPDFVPEPERIAVFDNDGTLWTEQPFYVQGLFLIDRARELAAKTPELMARPPFKAIVENDRAAMARFGEQEIGELVAETHTGMTPGEFAQTVRAWLASARHPRFGRPFTECVYQPMLELLGYLRAHGFKTFIVSGGGVDFLRVFAEDVYGVPPEQVVGSSAKTRFEMRDGRAVLIKLPEVNSIDDKEGKPRNIHLHVGRRPILAFGNSDGDLQMLQYTAAGSGPRLMLLLHHDDADREYAYDRQSKVGRLDTALDEAGMQGWLVVSLKKDFNRVFPFDQAD